MKLYLFKLESHTHLNNCHFHSIEEGILFLLEVVDVLLLDCLEVTQTENFDFHLKSLG